MFAYLAGAGMPTQTSSTPTPMSGGMQVSIEHRPVVHYNSVIILATSLRLTLTAAMLVPEKVKQSAPGVFAGAGEFQWDPESAECGSIKTISRQDTLATWCS